MADPAASTKAFPDVARFIDLIRSLPRHALPAARDLFAPDREVVVARAPGRLDVMGGIADYSGSLVLQLPIREATLAAAQRSADRTLRVVTLSAEGGGRRPAFEVGLDALAPNGRALHYDRARALFAKDAATAWAGYALGAVPVLMREAGAAIDGGLRLLIASDVPEGKGVSSSAALEVAAATAIAAAFGVPVAPREMAMLCQKVENRVVGAPCGVMDQMTSVCGEAGRLLELLCQPAELQGTAALPADLAVWGIDSGIRHSVAGADYGSVRVGAFMGYRMIAGMAGLKVEKEGGGVAVTDPLWGGYLANIAPSLFEARFAGGLPERMAGREFLRACQGTTDPVTTVDENRDYAVRVPARHPVTEHFRVSAFRELLGTAEGVGRARLLGELMYQSHGSYSACGLGSDGTDRLVALVREEAGAGLYGAKITGGGSGGTVAVLGRRDAGDAVSRVAARYAEERGFAPYVFTGSSPGAAAFGLVRLAPLPGPAPRGSGAEGTRG